MLKMWRGTLTYVSYFLEDKQEEVHLMGVEQFLHVLCNPTNHSGASTPVVPLPPLHLSSLPPLCFWPSARPSSSTPQAAGAHTHTCGWSDPSGLQRILIYGPEEPQIWPPLLSRATNCRGKGKLFITRRAFHFVLGVSGPEAEAWISPQWQVEK